MDKQAVNLTSFNHIQQELMTTIDEASTHLETFINEQDNHTVLESCINSLQQIRGSLDLVQLYGACELAGEILNTAIAIRDGEVQGVDDKLSVLTKGFFVLSCYFEYIQQHEVGMPVLLIPYINDIRLANRVIPLPESFFEAAQTSYRCTSSKTSPITDEQVSALRRYRHMYQIGLLGVMKETNTQQSLQMMMRSIGKVYTLSQGSASETLWWLASSALKAFADNDLETNTTRKHLFRTLDKELRFLQTEGVSAFERSPDDDVLKELAYLIAISGSEQTELQKIVQLFAFENVGYNDKILQQETINLTGPNANTVQSVAEVLRMELNVCKEQIEQAQSLDSDFAEPYEDTIGRIQKIKEILNVVGLVAASDILADPLERIEDAKTKNEAISSDNILVIADAFLYIESVLSSLEKRNFSGEKLAEINQLTQTEIISSSHLQDAQLMVIEQIEEAIRKVKMALTAFAESDYDKSNVEDLSDILTEMRGGMIVLDMSRAGDVLDNCTKFIEETLMSTDEIAALEQMMETFADALICIEYYIDSVKIDKNASTDTLKIAEESLAALGYANS